MKLRKRFIVGLVLSVCFFCWLDQFVKAMTYGWLDELEGYVPNIVYGMEG